MRHGDPAPAATAVEEPGGGDAAVVLAGFGARGELVLSGEGCSELRLRLPSVAGRRVEECRPRDVASANGERPDGTLTASYRDEVVTFRACAEPGGCAATLIGRAQLERAARRHPSVPDRPARLRAIVDGVAWLSDTRAAVSISIRLGARVEGLGPARGRSPSSATAGWSPSFRTSGSPAAGSQSVRAGAT
jgi:hypothetical protein